MIVIILTTLTGDEPSVIEPTGDLPYGDVVTAEPRDAVIRFFASVNSEAQLAQTVTAP